MQVFDNISTANLACSLFENCALIGKNANGNFELFSESNDDTAFDLQDYDLSIPTMDKTQTSLIYGNFHNYINHISHSGKLGSYFFLRFHNYTKS